MGQSRCRQVHATSNCLSHVSRNHGAQREHTHLLSTKSNSTRKQGLRETKTMKKEYDFSKAERGKFYRKGAKLRLPIYLDTKVQGQLERIAKKEGKDIADLVTQMVRKELDSLQGRP